ncbi:glycosyltransferase [Treponema peruense]|uniref:Glycosyltransferase n=1 Tax=Treponema peruense TaxID=2787628 RepID=A0A7T3RBD5_9SPIR|nr:glycosyltransferase [Treponema peruense]QPZ99961.1 glycosyltransferase [Treponema peruense]
MKTAIVHDWLVNYGGAERVVEQMLLLYPDADIYTLVYDEKKMGKIFPKEKVHTSSLQKIPMAEKLYTKFLSLMPKAFEEFDLTGYDLVIASSSCCAKGVITSPTTPFIAYIHSPMRYAWDLYYDYLKNSGRLTKFFMKRWMPDIRKWDYISSQRIDTLVANSSYIARRIKKFWNRDAAVVYPPVDTDRLSVSDEAAGDYFVVFSRFVPYKRIDLAISACARLNKKLIVIGSGSQEKELKLLAASCKNADIKFTGRISDSEVKAYLQKCRALIFCAEEDFGIIPVEAQACGRPIIAFGKGGALETVVNEKTGVFFEEQSVESLVKAIEEFEKLDKENTFNPKKIREHAEKFSAENFRKNLSEQIRLTEDKVRNYI